MSEVEKMNEAMYERLGEIAKFASNKHVELDPDFKGGRPDDAQNRLMLAAFRELRQMCEFYKPGEPQNTNLRQSDESTRMPQEPIREDSPNSSDSRSEIEKMNSALFGILRKTVVIATDAMHDYIEEGITEEEGNARFFAACAEIRQLIDVYKPSEKVKVEERDEPIMPGCPSLMPRQLLGGFDGVEAAVKVSDESKYGLLKNGVQMIRYASGPTVQLIGKRERGPHERQDGKTGKVIYKVMLSRESKSAEVSVDGVSKMTLVGGSNTLLEHAGIDMLNCIIMFNARQQRHKKDRYNRRKAEAAAAKQQAHDNKEGK